jgi:hypothetical protein
MLTIFILFPSTSKESYSHWVLCKRLTSPFT